MIGTGNSFLSLAINYYFLRMTADENFGTNGRSDQTLAPFDDKNDFLLGGRRGLSTSYLHTLIPGHN